MYIMWIILKFIIANSLLFIISSTLIGFILRGLLQPSTPNPFRGHKAEWYAISPKRGVLYALGATCVTILLFVLIYDNSNIYIILGMILIMLSRVKDLLQEIKTGVKTTYKTASMDKLDTLNILISFLGIGLFNYGLYIVWIK